MSPALAGGFFTPNATREALCTQVAPEGVSIDGERIPSWLTL